MCLALPMQIVEIVDTIACCHSQGIERQVSLFMLKDESLQVGDYVMVHVGYAIQKVSQQEAVLAWEMFDQMSALATDSGSHNLHDKDHA